MRTTPPLTEGWESDNSLFHTRRRACLAAARERADGRLAVLLVEQDAGIAQQLIDAFAGQPVELLHCADPAVGLLYVGRMCPDAVVLGPTRSGFGAMEFLTVVRRYDEPLPIIVGAGAGSGDLAARATELGATAVVQRPYPIRELLGMLRSFAPQPDEVELRPLMIDLGRLRVDGVVPKFWLDGREVSLPPQEFILLRYFAERVGAALTRKELNRAVWGDKLGVRSNSLTVHIMRLRKRLGDDEQDPQWIKVVRGLGYLFQVPERSANPGDVPVQSRSTGGRSESRTV
jgi:DNA-binding response OmpR family regulator